MIRQVPDAALGQVHIVVEEHVAGTHLSHREVPDDGMDAGPVSLRSFRSPKS
jgi:hypothetical protein